LLACLATVSATGHGINEVIGRHPVLAVLVGSVLLIQGTRRDIERNDKFGAGFWQFLALSYLASFLVWAILSAQWLGAVALVVALCVEIWLVKRWWSSHEAA
jgi:hypothetical protein